MDIPIKEKRQLNKISDGGKTVTEFNQKLKQFIKQKEEVDKKLADLEIEKKKLEAERDKIELARKDLEKELQAEKDEKDKIELERDDLLTEKTEWELKDKKQQERDQESHQILNQMDQENDNWIAEIEAMNKTLDSLLAPK